MENVVNPYRSRCVFIPYSRALGPRSGRNVLKPDYGRDGAACPWDVFRSEMIISPFGRLMSPAKPLPRQDLELILEHTASLWEEVRCSRIFLTGGPGFFGCWLVERFCFVNNLLGL